MPEVVQQAEMPLLTEFTILHYNIDFQFCSNTIISQPFLPGDAYVVRGLVLALISANCTICFSWLLSTC